MQPTDLVRNVPFFQNARPGQKEVFKRLTPDVNRLCVQLPTGYGKTLTALGAYSILKRQKRVDNLLVIFPTLAQIEQFVVNGPRDMRMVGVDGPLAVYDVSYWTGKDCLDAKRNNKSQSFAITAHSLIQPNGWLAVNDLMKNYGKWMVVVDEYHHYGIKSTWGKTVNKLVEDWQCPFLLAMSATPYRPNRDGAFGKPDVVVSYRAAAEAGCVKKLMGHSYVYRIDLITSDGDVATYTTDELVANFGDEGNEMEKRAAERKMRWSPKYISPLVSVPIERMLRTRLETGYRVQAIVGAMCVSHAKMVCEQIQSMFPDLTVEWVGTGENGRLDGENAEIVRKFCPSKDAGQENHEIDVLVHVGIAGEGLDTTHVSEIIHLNRASINNSNNQENGRAARKLGDVKGHINFDSASEYARAKHVGAAIMDAMDGNPPQEDEKKGGDGDGDGDGGGYNPPPLPIDPVHIYHMELDNIRSGDPEVVMYKKLMIQDKELFGGFGFTEKDLDDPNSDIHEKALRGYKMMRRKEAELHNEQSVSTQWNEAVNTAISTVTGLVVRKMLGGKTRYDKALAGDVKRKINSRKKRDLGELSKSVEVCKRHYQWLRDLEQTVNNGGLPQWLV